MALCQLLYGVLKERWKACFIIPPGGENKPETWEAHEGSLTFFLLPIWRNPVAYACLFPLSFLVTRDLKSAMSLMFAITSYAPYARRDAEKLIPIACGVWIRFCIELRSLWGMLRRGENWLKVLMLFLHVLRRGLKRLKSLPLEFGLATVVWIAMRGSLCGAIIWYALGGGYMPTKNLVRREMWRYMLALCIMWSHPAIFIMGMLAMALVPPTPLKGWMCYVAGWGDAVADWLVRSIWSRLGLVNLTPVGTIEMAQDEDGHHAEYVEPWVDQFRDVAKAAAGLLLLAVAMWYISPASLLLLIGLLLENPVRGESGYIGLEDGDYVIMHRLWTITYARTAACVVNGVLHTVAHTGLISLRHRGVRYDPTGMSLEADVVTWGGPPAFKLHEAGDTILIGSITSGLFDNETELLPAVQVKVGGSVSYARADGVECMVGCPVFAFSSEYQRHILIGMTGQLFEDDGLGTNCGVMAWVEDEEVVAELVQRMWATAEPTGGEAEGAEGNPSAGLSEEEGG